MRTSFVPSLLGAWLVCVCAIPALAQARPPVQAQTPKGAPLNADAKVVGDFRARVDEYVKLRNAAAHGAPAMKGTPEPDQISSGEQTMSHKIREKRAHAGRGDIFTPATEALFRRLVQPAVTQGPNAADNKAIIKDDAPHAGEVPLKVNGAYPKDAPLSTVPPDVLLRLPPLPDDLQYRFVGRHLILYDAKPNLIVDFMLNAIP